MRTTETSRALLYLQQGQNYHWVVVKIIGLGMFVPIVPKQFLLSCKSSMEDSRSRSPLVFRIALWAKKGFVVTTPNYVLPEIQRIYRLVGTPTGLVFGLEHLQYLKEILYDPEGSS